MARLILNRRKAACLEQETHHEGAVKLTDVKEGSIALLNLLRVLSIRGFFEQLHQEALKNRVVSSWVQ